MSIRVSTSCGPLPTLTSSLLFIHLFWHWSYLANHPLCCVHLAHLISRFFSPRFIHQLNHCWRFFSYVSKDLFNHFAFILFSHLLKHIVSHMFQSLVVIYLHSAVHSPSYSPVLALVISCQSSAIIHHTVFISLICSYLFNHFFSQGLIHLFSHCCHVFIYVNKDLFNLGHYFAQSPVDTHCQSLVSTTCGHIPTCACSFTGSGTGVTLPIIHCTLLISLIGLTVFFSQRLFICWRSCWRTLSVTCFNHVWSYTLHAPILSPVRALVIPCQSSIILWSSYSFVQPFFQSPVHSFVQSLLALLHLR